jgi:folate-binding protein YgfZ
LDHANRIAVPGDPTIPNIPSGDVLEAGYRALKDGAGVRLCSERTVIRMSGDDRASFLHGMCSNDINGLKPGSLVGALFLNERAHLIAEGVVWATADALLLEMESVLWPAVRTHLERFLVADDVEFEESADSVKYGVIEVDGPRAAAAVVAVFGEAAALPGAWRFGEAEDGVLIAQVVRWGAPAFTILAPRASAPEIVVRLAASGSGEGQIHEVTIDAREIVRVESGVARVGLDTNEKTIALEARMESAISFSKGCYIGQETVERATARGALKRRLFGLRIDGARIPAPGASVTLAGKEVGYLTSPLRSPRLGMLALAVLHHSAWAPGTEVTIDDANGAMRASVSELPFADDPQTIESKK